MRPVHPLHAPRKPHSTHLGLGESRLCGALSSLLLAHRLAARLFRSLASRRYPQAHTLQPPLEHLRVWNRKARCVKGACGQRRGRNVRGVAAQLQQFAKTQRVRLRKDVLQVRGTRGTERAGDPRSSTTPRPCLGVAAAHGLHRGQSRSPRFAPSSLCLAHRCGALCSRTVQRLNLVLRDLRCGWRRGGGQ